MTEQILSLSSTCYFFIVSIYLVMNSLFLCCHSSSMARLQFCLGLGVTAMMNTAHTHTHKKKSSIIYYHSTNVNIHKRSGGDSGRACDAPVTGNQEYPDYRLFLQKRMCVTVMLPCRVIWSFSISAVGCAFPTSQRWKKSSVTFFSCSDCQATVKSRD